MKTQILFFVLLTIILFLTGLLLPEALTAQGAIPPNPTPSPIDGGLALLAVAGGAYAYKKLRKKD